MVTRHTRKIAVHTAFAALFLATVVPTAPAGEPEQLVVSMVHLLTHPSDLDGKIVLVRGYLRSGFGMRLYLTKDHADISDSASSVRVEVPDPELLKCGDAYVAVNGLFGLRNDEYAIVKTLEVTRWSDGSVPVSTCWKRKTEE